MHQVPGFHLFSASWFLTHLCLQPGSSAWISVMYTRYHPLDAFWVLQIHHVQNWPNDLSSQSVLLLLNKSLQYLLIELKIQDLSCAHSSFYHATFWMNMNFCRSHLQPLSPSSLLTFQSSCPGSGYYSLLSGLLWQIPNWLPWLQFAAPPPISLPPSITHPTASRMIFLKCKPYIPLLKIPKLAATEWGSNPSAYHTWPFML